MNVLYEGTIGDEIEAQFNDEGRIKSTGDIEEALDMALDAALEAQGDVEAGGDGEFPSILLKGPAGSGKTSRVKSWAKQNNINLFVVSASSMDESDLGGVIVPDNENKVAQRYSLGSFGPLDRPRSVLFLDEFNRAPGTVRGTLLTLINDHMIPGTNDSGQKYFENLLFVVAAINPKSDGYQTNELDPAEVDRFYDVNVVPEKGNHYRYLTDLYTDKMERAKANGDTKLYNKSAGRLGIAQKLLSSPEFRFTTDEERDLSENERSVSPRGLTKLLQLSDGTKTDFLKKWNGILDSNMKPIAEKILSNYKDVENKANSVFNGQDVFGKKADNAFTKISKYLD